MLENNYCIFKEGEGYGMGIKDKYINEKDIIIDNLNNDQAWNLIDKLEKQQLDYHDLDEIVDNTSITFGAFENDGVNIDIRFEDKSYRDIISISNKIGEVVEKYLYSK